MRPYWTAFREGNLCGPVTSLTLEVDWRLGGGKPFWFHLVNLLLHTGVVLLFHRLLRKLAMATGAAAVTAFLFAVRPVHTEVVTWISGRSEPLAGLFTLAAMNLSLARTGGGLILSVLACLFAVGSKESGAMAPLLVHFTAWVFRGANFGGRLPGRRLLWRSARGCGNGGEARLHQRGGSGLSRGDMEELPVNVTLAEARFLARRSSP